MKESQSIISVFNVAIGLLLVFNNVHSDSQWQNETIPSCKGQTFCENVANYPFDAVKKIISKHSLLKNYSNLDMVEPLKPTLPMHSEYGTKLCQSIEKIIFPKTAENMNNEWSYVLNTDDVVQGVHIEKCVNEGKHCSSINGLARGYITVCKQRYVHNQLLGLQKGGSYTYQQFRFPSNCYCYIEYVGPDIRLVEVADFQNKSSDIN
ncbi:protein spaetzle-like [Bombus bifarius]|uniref:Protein spaetzle-like n=1 Tax=Bombus bifarius TaxID=103933 RepID=A0A6P8N311_9HYME|nr:protein spaetzle-like [Bombus bifarius]XP_033315039.1 protein spaetzle-like [Bombus bifarius]XP_033315050.1 protein spaetzle-like [Bombus bifarius]